MSKICKCECMPRKLNINQLKTNNECGCPKEVEKNEKCGVWPHNKVDQKCSCNQKSFWATSPIIEIHQGKLFGKVCDDLNGRPYYSFQGIPYAKPPLDHLRFLSPVPPDTWGEEVLDCSAENNPCFGVQIDMKTPMGNENCLFLNVYTPYLPSEHDELLPVMVWIHGGKFLQGSSSCEIFGPEFLVAKNIVLVTLNYRLGYFGFLKLSDPEAGAPGNAGLKDQVQALRWVKHNIENFCGNKNNVTIFGSSAGGASVHLLTLSPTTKGLFHKAIIQSGVALSPWAMQIRKDYELARAFGCKSNEDKQILKFLQNIKASRFINQEQEIFPVSERMVGEICAATPTIEQPPRLGSFISKRPECLMASGKFHHVPIMIGVCRNEGLSFLSPQFFQKISPQFVDNTLLIPRDLRNFLHTDEKIKEFGNRIKEFYYNGDCPSLANLNAYCDYFTDVAFAHKVQLTAKYFAKHKIPVYNYCISLDTPINGERLRYGVEYKGTNHYDEITYLFKTSKTPCVIPHTPEGIGVDIMTTYWTNFAKYSNPNPRTIKEYTPYINIEWKPYTLEEPWYMDIDTKLYLNQNLFKERMEFWDQLYVDAAMHASLK